MALTQLAGQVCDEDLDVVVSRTAKQGRNGGPLGQPGARLAYLAGDPYHFVQQHEAKCDGAERQTSPVATFTLVRLT